MRRWRGGRGELGGCERTCAVSEHALLKMVEDDCHIDLDAKGRGCTTQGLGDYGVLGNKELTLTNCATTSETLPNKGTAVTALLRSM